MNLKTVNVLETDLQMRGAKYILGYSHNDKSPFGKNAIPLEYDISKTLLTHVESSIASFPDYYKETKK